MTESTHTTLATYDVPGGIIDAVMVTYESGTVSYHVGFITIDGSTAVRSSVISQHDNEDLTRRAAARLYEHMSHVVAVAIGPDEDRD